MKYIATIIFLVAILGLFTVDLNRKPRTSFALWIPTIWFLIIASRPVSIWLGLAPESSAEQVLDGSPIDRIVFLVLLTLGLAVLVDRRSEVRQLLTANTAIVLYFSYCCISILWSDYPWVAWKRWLKLVGDLVMVLIVLTDPQSRAAFRRFLAWPTFLLIPLSVLFIKYYPHLGRYYTNWTFQPIVGGVTLNKNLLGVICLFWGVGLVWRFLEQYRSSTLNAQSIAVFGGLLTMTLWLLVLADSATSLACFAIGVMILFWTRIPRVARRPALVHVVTIAMIFIPLAVLFVPNVGTTALDLLERDQTLTGRTELWQYLFNMTESPVLGAGFESFWLGPRLQKLWSIYWWRPNQAHNGYIEIFINLGWAGLLLLVIMLGTGYRRNIKGVSQGRHGADLMLAYVVIAIVYNYTEASFRMQNLAWVFFLFAVIGIPTQRRDRGGEPVPSEVLPSSDRWSVGEKW